MARAALNWTVRDLAEATGLHRNTINKIEVYDPVTHYQQVRDAWGGVRVPDGR